MDKTPEKTIEMLTNAKSCALILDQNPKEECFLLKNALKLALNELNIVSFSYPENNDTLKYYSEKWSPILKDLVVEQEEKPKAILKIPKKDILIKELSYNESDDFFSLIITPKQGRVIKESLILEETFPKPDVFLCFFEDMKKFGFLKNEIEFPESGENVVMFTSREEADLGGVKKTLTERITDLIQLLQVNFSPLIADLLFASLILETNKFKYYLSKDIFSLANFLVSRGANSKQISEILESQRTDSFVQLLGRAAARTHYDDKLNAMWTFVQTADFEKTGNSPSLNLILKLTKELEGIVKSAKVYAFFWQKSNEIWIVLKSFDEVYLSKVSNILDLIPNSDYLIIGPYENFSEAELKVRETLNKIEYESQKELY